MHSVRSYPRDNWHTLSHGSFIPFISFSEDEVLQQLKHVYSLCYLQLQMYLLQATEVS